LFAGFHFGVSEIAWRGVVPFTTCLYQSPAGKNQYPTFPLPVGDQSCSAGRKWTRRLRVNPSMHTYVGPSVQTKRTLNRGRCPAPAPRHPSWSTRIFVTPLRWTISNLEKVFHPPCRTDTGGSL